MTELLFGEIVFFRPTRNFWKQIDRYKDRTIIEVGCGAGFLSRQMQAKQFKVVPVDIQIKDTQVPGTQHIDAIDFPYTSDMVVLFCRPSHGNWVWRVIDRAQEVGATVVYVGLQENLELDLGDLQDKFHQRGDSVGEESEVFMVDRTEEEEPWHAHKTPGPESWWCLVQTSYHSTPWWLEDKGDEHWHNVAGGYCPRSESDKVLARVSGELDYDELDHKQTGLFHKSGTNAGWLTPDGKFYPCSGEAHDQYARLILHTTVEKLEKEGYARVYSDRPEDWICIGGATDKQAVWLKKHDRTVHDYHMKSWRVKTKADDQDLPKKKPIRPFKKGRQREGD